jgi:hypothetical protein
MVFLPEVWAALHPQAAVEAFEDPVSPLGVVDA